MAFVVVIEAIGNDVDTLNRCHLRTKLRDWNSNGSGSFATSAELEHYLAGGAPDRLHITRLPVANHAAEAADGKHWLIPTCLRSTSCSGLCE